MYRKMVSAEDVPVKEGLCLPESRWISFAETLCGGAFQMVLAVDAPQMCGVVAFK
jgi:hypothetical protein